jgi:hypothetical protein
MAEGKDLQPLVRGSGNDWASFLDVQHETMKARGSFDVIVAHHTHSSQP